MRWDLQMVVCRWVLASMCREEREELVREGGNFTFYVQVKKLNKATQIIFNLN